MTDNPFAPPPPDACGQRGFHSPADAKVAALAVAGVSSFAVMRNNNRVEFGWVAPSEVFTMKPHLIETVRH